MFSVLITAEALNNDSLKLLFLTCAAVEPRRRRDVAVDECNAPLATWMKAVLVVPKKQGLAFVVEREDGSRSGETAPGRSRGRRQ